MKGKEFGQESQTFLPLSSGTSQRTGHTVGRYSAHQLHQLFLIKTGRKFKKKNQCLYSSVNIFRARDEVLFLSLHLEEQLWGSVIVILLNL